MRKTIHFILGLVLVIATSMGFAASGSEVSQKCLPEALVLSEKARNLNYAQVSQVSYIVEEKYPAKHLLREVTAKLSAQGWKPLDYDPLNPTNKSINMHHWTSFLDATQGPDDIKVDQWMGWFDNSNGSRLLLGLRYLNRFSGGAGAKTVRVFLSHKSSASHDSFRW